MSPGAPFDAIATPARTEALGNQRGARLTPATSGGIEWAPSAVIALE